MMGASAHSIGARRSALHDTPLVNVMTTPSRLALSLSVFLIVALAAAGCESGADTAIGGGDGAASGTDGGLDVPGTDGGTTTGDPVTDPVTDPVVDPDPGTSPTNPDPASTGPLAIISVKPGSGPVEGGTIVAIQGQGIRSDVEVLIGDVLATNVAVQAGVFATAVTPANAEEGRVDVTLRQTITDPETEEETVESVTLPAAFEYRAGLRVDEVVPDEGEIEGGELVIVRGAGFLGSASVFFGDVPASDVTVEGSGIISLVVPPGDTGAVDVTVKLSDGSEASRGNGYEYLAPPVVEEIVPLALHEVMPNSGPEAGGAVVVLEGQGFEPGLQVRFGDLTGVDVDIHGDSVLTVLTPAGAGDSFVDVTVTRLDEATATIPSGYWYEAEPVIEEPVEPDPPTPLALFDIDPDGGPAAGGNLAILKGQGFAPGDVVWFGETKAFDVQLESEGLVTVTVPPGADGTVDVTITGLDDETATIEAAYTYSETQPLGVSAVQPNEGLESGGMLAMLTGSGFEEGATVMIDGANAPAVTVASSHVIVFTIPAGEAGAANLTVTNPNGDDATLPDGFTYTAVPLPDTEAPTASAIAPTSGPDAGGTPVIIAGSGFGAGTTVWFGDVAAADTVILSGHAIKAVTPPADVPGGAADVVVVNAAGEAAALQSAFQYSSNTGAAPAPQLLLPGSGPTTGGTLATLTGTGFQSGAVVWFGDKLAAGVAVIDAETIVLNTPTGNSGAATVTVVNPDGTAGSLANAFGYFIPGSIPAQPPLVAGVHPSSGWTSGGQVVTVTGSGFTTGSWVHFGTQPAEIVSISGGALAKVITPAQPAGTVDVTVTSPQGLSHTLDGGFVYFELPPFLASIDPAEGPPAGGTEVVLTGKHFEPGAIVQVGGVSLQGAVIEDSEHITVTMPPHGAGAVDVVVTNPSGLSDGLSGGYSYAAPQPPEPPAVTGVSPSDGSMGGGFLAVITGDGFALGATVWFGDIPAELTEVHSPGVITALVPEGEAGMTVDVRVSNPGGLEGAMELAFTWVDDNVLAPLSLVAIIPGTGPTDGGNIVTVTGTGFVSGTSVSFGETPAESVAYVSSTVLTVVAPAGDSGLVDVVVTRPDQQQAIAFNSYLYATSDPDIVAPTIISLSPTVGPETGGSVVELHGAGFQTGATVFFGADAASGVTVVSPQLLVVHTGAAGAGTVSVTVTNPDGGSAVVPGAFTFYEPIGVQPPLVFAVNPFQGSALGGSEATVNGTGFQIGVSVFICGAKADVLEAFPTTITILTPPGPLGSCPVEAVNPDGFAALLQGGFKYVAAQPSVAKIIPSVGTTDGGSSLVIQGGGFMAGAQVLVGGIPAPQVTVWSSTTINAVTPAGSAGPADIQVLNPGGASVTVEDGFVYQSEDEPSEPPVITALFPTVGPVAGGTPVEIYGSGFEEGLTVLLGGTLVEQVAVINPELLTLITPAGAPGPSALTILNPSGLGATLPNAFEYSAVVADPPSLLGVSPQQGPQSGGTTLTISGAKLKSGGQFFVGGKPLLNTTPINESVVTGVTPLGLPGPADVLYVGPDGQFAKIDGVFTYIPGPTVDAVEPQLGPLTGETQVTLIGTNFKPDMNVFFGGQQGQVVSAQSDLIAVVTTPPGLAPGIVDVTVVNPDGQSADLVDGFRYLAAPVLQWLTPEQGPESGGTPVTLKGAGFYAGATVDFGTLASTEVAVLSDATIIAVSPAHIPGPVDVVVTNPDGQETVLEGGFTFKSTVNLEDAPIIAGLLPQSAPIAGGVTVTILGSGFQEGVGVLFGTTEGIDVTRLGEGMILAVAPAAEVGGEVNVAVVNPDGQVAAAPVPFAYVDDTLPDPPALTGVQPTSGPTSGGNVVLLTGNGFAAGMQVFFGLTLSETVTVVGPTEAQVVAPAHLETTVGMMIVSPEGQATVKADAYSFAAPPLVISTVPAFAASVGGLTVTVLGTGFVDGLSVLFCDSYSLDEGCVGADGATVEVHEDGQGIDLIAPAHAPGTVDVVVVNPDGQVSVDPASFIYNPLPSVVSAFPTEVSTLGGDALSLSGAGFQVGAEASIGGVPCQGVTVSAADQLVCITPAGEPGPADVWVINPDGGEAIGEAIVELVAPPVLLGVNPTSGAESGDTQVTLTGTGFVAGSPKSAVFLGDAEVPPEDVDVLSDTVIVIRTPAGVGAVPIEIINPDGQSAIVGGAFVYIPPTPGPVLSYCLPKKGLTSGGYTVQIVGFSLMEGAQVYFGVEGDWTEALDVSVKNAGTLITVTVPSREPGTVNIRVVNTDGQETQLGLAFDYIAPETETPLVYTAVAPAKAVIAGGTSVTVTGQGFLPGVAVLFGKDPDFVVATQTDRLGPSLLRVTVPPAPSGLAEVVDLKVANPPAGGVEQSVVAVDAFEYSSGAVFRLADNTRLPPEPHEDRFAMIVDGNGDGHNDVMAFRVGKDDRLMLNVPREDGDTGWFELSWPWTTPSGMHSANHAVKGDFDEDGDVDIIVHGDYTRLWWCSNDGDATYTCFEFYGINWNCNGAVRELTATDVNCDGHLDVIVAQFSTSSNCPNLVYLGDGAGSFWLRTDVLPAQYEHTNRIAAADVDLDGDVDLLLANDDAMQNRLHYNNCNNVLTPPACTNNTMPNCTHVEYDGHQYAICTNGLNWETARTQCKRYGFELASIGSDEERDFLWDQIGDWSWLGYDDRTTEGDWNWFDSGTDYSSWCGGDPDNESQDCGLLTKYGDHCIAERDCNEGRRYVCESLPDVGACETPWGFGDALYGAGKNFPISGGNARDVAFTDLDKNGFVDAVVANFGQQTAVYLNFGGNFELDDELHWPQDEANPKLNKLHPVDIDLDGDKDMIVLADGGEIRVYLNDYEDGGAGVLTDVTADRLPLDPTRGDVWNIAVGDLDGDLLPDIYVTNNFFQDRILFNNGYAENLPWIDDNRVGAGSFAHNTFGHVPQHHYYGRGIEVGDIDGDGDLDLVKCGWRDTLRVLMNQGGRFTDESSPRIGDQIYECSFKGLQLVDFDADGDLDVIVGEKHDENCGDGHCSGNMWLFYNDGDGFFTDVTDDGIPKGNWRTESVAVNDLDLDGDLDIFLASYNPQYYNGWTDALLLNVGDPFNTGSTHFFHVMDNYFGAYKASNYAYGNTILDYIYTAQFVDFDGLPPDDLYLGRNGQNQIFLASGDNDFLRVTDSWLPSVSTQTFDAAIVDFDLDGDLDIYEANQGQDRFNIREADALYADITTSSLGTIDAVTRNSRDVEAHDLDGDGYPDIVIANWEQRNSFLGNLGEIAFTDLTPNLPEDWDRSAAVKLFDIDGDGDRDAYVVNEGQDRIYINTTID